MEKFILFAYYQYYPCGGLSDIIGIYNSKDEFDAALNNLRKCYDYVEALNTETLEMHSYEYKDGKWVEY